MGNSPSVPTVDQEKQLAASFEESTKRAADAIGAADAVLVCLGGAVANLPPGPLHTEGASGSWEAPPLSLIHENPASFYGYWGRWFNQNRDGMPHIALATIATWPTLLSGEKSSSSSRRRDEVGTGPKSWYIFTSNTDGRAPAAFARSQHSSDCGTTRIHCYECFGSTETWRCAAGCSAGGNSHGHDHGHDDDGDGHDGSASTPLSVPRWRAPEGFRFAVHCRGRAQPIDLAEPAGLTPGPKTGTGDGSRWVAPAGAAAVRPQLHVVQVRFCSYPPPGGLTPRLALLRPLQMTGEDEMDYALDSATSFNSNYPRCPLCLQPARPDLRMRLRVVEDIDNPAGCQGDWYQAPEAAERHYEGWKRTILQRLQRPTTATTAGGARAAGWGSRPVVPFSVVVVEVGCGGGGKGTAAAAVGDVGTGRSETEAFVNAALQQQQAEEEESGEERYGEDDTNLSAAMTLIRIHDSVPLPDTPALQEQQRRQQQQHQKRPEYSGEVGAETRNCGVSVISLLAPTQGGIGAVVQLIDDHLRAA